ncbi:MAG: phage holin family protein [Cyclobacteriaceae bacterium]|nr:phage holin family protein [Cyclobacteriaceae bacterium]
MENNRLLKLLKLDNLIDHLSGYIEDKIELVKIEAKEEVAVFLTKAIIIIVMVLFFVFALFFSTIVLAMYLNKVLEDSIIGYGIVSLMYLLLFILVLIFKNYFPIHQWIEKRVNKNSD